MTDLTRRKALQLAMLAPLMPASAFAVEPGQDLPPAAKESQPMDHDTIQMSPAMHKVPWMGNEQVAMLMYPGMTVLDLIGPQSMFGSMMGAKIMLVAKTMQPVTSDAGVTITPHATFETCPRDLTVLCVPGGTDGTLAAAADPATLAFLADRGSRAKYITSVCSGSLVLGAAGLLKGYRATSHWSVRQVLAKYGAIPTDARVVQDRKRITGAGVTAGLDMGLTMVGILRGQLYAESTQLVAEYDPNPPFHAGSLKTAPPEVREAMVNMLESFTKKAEALATRQSV